MTRQPYDPQDEDSFSAYLQRSGRGAAFTIPAADESILALFCRVNLESVRLYFRDSFQTRTKAGEGFRVLPAIVDRASPNAFAARGAGVHLCGIHAALIPILINLSGFVFCQAGCMPEIGDASKERSPDFHDDLLHITAGDHLSWDAACATEIKFRPRDDARLVAAMDIAQLMLRFVWLHELFHGLNGHVGYLAQYDGQATLFEMPEAALVTRAPVAGLTTDEQHALELDADRMAFWASYRLQAADREVLVSLTRHPMAARLKMTLLASFLMTFVFERVAPAAIGSHPLPYIRLHNLVRTLASHLIEGTAADKALFASVLSELQTLRPKLPELPDIAQFYTHIHSREFQAPMDALEDVLEQLRPRLAPFVFSQPGGEGGS